MNAGRVMRNCIVLGIVAVDAGDRMLHVWRICGISHVGVADDVESLHQVAVAELQVGR